MEFVYLSKTVVIKTTKEDDRSGIFEVEGLYGGYGLTIGNALRRTLLSSLPGAAVTQIKIKNVPHEFSTLPGVKEDILEITLNFKKLRFKVHTNEPQTIYLKVQGEKDKERIVIGADFKLNSEVEIINPEIKIVTLTAKNAEFNLEALVERGLGYSPLESRRSEKLPIGTIAIDALFSPVTRVNYQIENMRVGERTDYNRLRIEIETDGTISPSAALHKSANILKDHFDKISAVEVKTADAEEAIGIKTEIAKKLKKSRTKK